MLIRPSPLAPGRVDVEPDAVVGDRQGRARRGSPSSRTETVRAPLCLRAFCSASWTMRNRHSVRSGGSAGGTSSWVNVTVMPDGESSLAKAVEGGHQADQPQPGRVQPVRQIVHALRDVLRAIERLGRQLLGSGAGSVPSSSSRSIDSSATCWLMSSCSSRAMRERSVSWALSSRAAEIANSLVARAQRRLASAHLLLGLPSSRPLNEQAGDQHRLRQQERQRAEDVEPVAIPDRGLPERDERARQARAPR